MNKKVVFVILHYMAIEETVNCINSICQNICYENYCIVVIDNGSGVVEDIQTLNDITKKENNIELVVLKENLGFARGNNVGFEIAKKNHDADFIVLINNDTIITQPNFCNIICQKYDKYHYAVLGPKIYLKDGTYFSNPMMPGKYITYRQRLAQILTMVRYAGSYLNLDVKRRCDKFATPKLLYNNIYDQDVLDYKLHGCCLIFSREYIDRFDGLNPETFLYMEEDILFIRLRNNNLHSLYSPDLWITHFEDAATNMLVHKGRKKRQFIYRNHIKSYSVLIKEIKKNR